MNSSHGHSPSIIHLNIGGRKFCTTLDTLTLREPDSMLAAMFSGRHNVNGQKSENGDIFIDRDGKHFRHILNWLRDGALPIMEYRGYMELLREAEYFQLVGLIGEIKAKAAGLMDQSRDKSIGSELTRIDIIKCIQTLHRDVGLQLQGVHLSGIDLSGLNLNRAMLTNANLKSVNLKGSNLTQSNLEGAILIGANMTQANLGRANLKSANLEGAILIGANMTQANLSSANLGRANLKSANLERAILHGAEMKYANLEDANLYCAELRFGPFMQDTNLTRANLQNAIIKVPDLSEEHHYCYSSRPRMPIMRDLEWAVRKFGITITGANLTDVNLSFGR